MFKIIILLLFLFLLYIFLKGEKRGVRLFIVSYFSLLSIVFLPGINYISSKYHLDDGPALEGGFEILFKWVSAFSYLYIIPLFLVVAYRIFRVTPSLFDKKWVRVVMFVFLIAVLVFIGYISFFIFTLIFYGFAP